MDLADALSAIPKMYDENLIVGLETSDDAAVYKISDEQAIILTLDFFTPVVDDPYTFGKIAAANSLSDIYAMGGEPKVAMNIVAFPKCKDMNILKEIMRGGAEKVIESGAILVGGHTVDDNEPKYGLSVTGFVHPERVKANADVKVGDVLILTKPIGVGILNTAIKGGLANQDDYDEAINVMQYLNKYPALAMKKVDVNGVTDITGFGLIGHTIEMAEGSNVTINLFVNKIPFLKNVIKFAEMGIVPAGAYENKVYFEDKVNFVDDIEESVIDVLYDPQTSGGLLISLPKDRADEFLFELKNSKALVYEIIGEAIEKEDKLLNIYKE